MVKVKLSAFFLMLALLLTGGGILGQGVARAAGEVPNVAAAAAVLIDAASGRVIFEMNAHQRLPQASTTKITTAIVAIEQEKDLQKKVRVPDDFVNPGEAGIWLEAGEEQTVEGLLHAMMLRSANDAAAMLAIDVGGSEAGFAQLMNKKVQEMGLQDTHYMNPHGLHHPDHYSSAYDLAMLAREGMKYPLFRKLVVTERFVLPWGNHEYSRVVYNHNRLLTRYPDADGVKTGYTKEAGSCLVGSATRDGLQLIAVVLDASLMYDQVAALLDYGFANYQLEPVLDSGKMMGKIPVSHGRQSEITVVASRSISAALRRSGDDQVDQVVELPDILDAPVEAGQVVGTVSLKIDEATTTQVDLVAVESVARKPGWLSAWTVVSRFLLFRWS